MSQLVPRNSVGTAQLRTTPSRPRRSGTTPSRAPRCATARSSQSTSRWGRFRLGRRDRRALRRTGAADLQGRSPMRCLPEERSAAPTTWAEQPRQPAVSRTRASRSSTRSLQLRRMYFVRQGTAAPTQCPGNATFPQATAGQSLRVRDRAPEHGRRLGERGQPLRSDDLHQLHRGRRLLQLRHLGGHRRLTLAEDPCSFAS